MYCVACVPLCSLTHRTLRREENSALSLSRGRSHIAPKKRMENARRAAFSFFPQHSGGCAPEAFVVAKQPSAALSVTRRTFRHMTCGALAAFWKVEMFLSQCGADAPGKNERVAPRPRRFHYERAYRASTFEITNLSAQMTRYVSVKYVTLPQSLRFVFFFPLTFRVSSAARVSPFRRFFFSFFRPSAGSNQFFLLHALSVWHFLAVLKKKKKEVVV